LTASGGQSKGGHDCARNHPHPQLPRFSTSRLHCAIRFLLAASVVPPIRSIPWMLNAHSSTENVSRSVYSRAYST
jgi:hypothetical protein